MERSGGRWHNPPAYQPGNLSQTAPAGLYASDHDVFIFMIDGGSMLEAGPRARLNRGFMTWNSETGARTFGLMTFLFNTVCGNHIIWGAQDVNKLLIVHRENGPTRFDNEASQTLKGFIESSGQRELDAIRKAQDILIPRSSGKMTLEDVISWTNSLKGSRFTRTEVKEAFEHARREEGDCRTLWHFVQGATAYARGFEWIDARTDLERRASKLLDLAG